MFLALCITGFIIYISYDIGVSSAIQQTEFRVVNTSPERVVLWITNNHVICAPFDRNSKHIEPTFIVLNLGENSEIEFSLEKIGPLKVKNISDPISPTNAPPISFTSTPAITTTP